MPFFFENEQGETVTVNGDYYRAMLNEYLLYIGTIWFQQDGATLHTAEVTLEFLKIALSAAEMMSFGHFGAAI